MIVSWIHEAIFCTIPALSENDIGKPKLTDWDHKHTAGHSQRVDAGFHSQTRCCGIIHQDSNSPQKATAPPSVWALQVQDEWVSAWHGVWNSHLQPVRGVSLTSRNH